MLLPIEENDKTTPTKAREISVDIPIFKYLFQYQREIIEFIKIGKINQERHSN